MKIEIVVTKKGLFGWLANRLGLDWSHAALRCVPESMPMYIIEASALGIRDVSWEIFIDKVEKYQVFQVKGGLADAQARTILGYAWGNVGKPYHYLWLLKIGWDLIRKKYSILHYPAHVCSSLVNQCFRYGGIDLVPGEGVLVLPDDLADSPRLEPA